MLFRSLDPRNPAFKDALAGSKVGEEVTLEVTGTVVNNGANFVVDVSKVESSAEENAESPEEEKAETDEADAGHTGENEGEGETGESAPMPDGKPLPGKKKGQGVVILIGKGGK